MKRRSVIVKRKAFVCVGCEHVYCDEPPTSCDCMAAPEFIEGTIAYKKPLDPATGMCEKDSAD